MRVAAAVALAVALSPMPPPAPQECFGSNVVSGTCDATIATDGLDVSATLISGAGSTVPVGLAGPGPAPSFTPRPMDPCAGFAELCRDEFGVNAPAPSAPALANTPITIADLASFTPAVGELIVQPDGWGVLGVPTNFHATATDHIQDGTVLGQPVQVRWRPVAFTFDYGDGTVTTTTDPGAPWPDTEEQWSATSTSHEYDERGAVTATLTITFAADIAGPTGWALVPGTLDLAAPTEQIRIFEVRTVLTRGDCIDYPHDPGCAP